MFAKTAAAQCRQGHEGVVFPGETGSIRLGLGLVCIAEVLLAATLSVRDDAERVNLRSEKSWRCDYVVREWRCPGLAVAFGQLRR